ncbi:DNA-directed RNA polymerase subunit alpha [Candidatus Kaiserbacteria bacterium RIFCSPLOWO2_02_FULL_56_11]|uniref:DNA-directed RNA polymerase subunit alpha n=1 Tax=Candidatus Kaiserbacteria bacterium RIFCSPHIGHO2_02_FULL_56_30 TaxID=1798499 RepID=A0A1F6E4G2_9BACT|nr:MAG: DNA-directed RNA polymerase subunit alpha [Candidatus Kaiserbacteria bacterium RIFCSPHIGHO2_02_FULL_56_30]OGG82098.1 MAG: DNA-directed RNA polymerase subunit alpha [Candidatus Kaiserbacteria bacterium RIFCSPLOWO2_02_FULL_56_11]
MTLPSKPRVVSEEKLQGVYEIDSLYPGYGHTLGNSLRRIILSSLPGATVTSVKIEGVPHEFATIEGMRESVIELLLNLKKVHFILHGDEPQAIKLKAKGTKSVTAADLDLPSQVEIMNPDQHIAELSGKNEFEMEATIERGLGYIPREVLTKEKVDIGTIALDATFTPIRRVNYEVENMRVGDRTDFNRLRILIETNGTITPRAALENAIETMIHQLKAVVGFQEEPAVTSAAEREDVGPAEGAPTSQGKTKIADLGLSARTAAALEEAGIKTAAGLARKSVATLKEVEGVGDKAIEEINAALGKLGFALKGE